MKLQKVDFLNVANPINCIFFRINWKMHENYIFAFTLIAIESLIEMLYRAVFMKYFLYRLLVKYLT